MSKLCQFSGLLREVQACLPQAGGGGCNQGEMSGFSGLGQGHVELCLNDGVGESRP